MKVKYFPKSKISNQNINFSYFICIYGFVCKFVNSSNYIYIYMVKIYYLGLLNENVTIVKLFWFVEEHYIKNNIIKK